MSPFLDDEDFEEYEQEKDQEKISPYVNQFLKDDKKFFAIGGVASLIAFGTVAYFLYSNSKPIDLEDLPVIQADPTPLKVKPVNNPQVNHQDKIVYDNISGNIRKKEEERVIAPPEEILSINEMDSEGVLSEEEKQKIISAFDELAPERDYKINYIKTGSSKKSKQNSANNNSKNVSRKITDSDNLRIVEGEPPIKRIGSALDSSNSRKNRSAKRQKLKLSDLIEENSIEGDKKGTVMVQIASLPTRNGAEAEYRRIANKNKIIKNFGKKIYKVDLGKVKGNTYRIQIGPFKNNNEAKKIISILKRNGCGAYIAR